jgi:type I restriction enzyme S subunit
MNSQTPQGWKLKSIGELSTVKRGASPRPIKDSKWWGGSVGWVRISDVTSSRKYLKKTTQYLSVEGVEKSVKIDKGEVVLTICATIGRAIIISVDACIHDGFVWFDKLGKSIDREYWYYFLASKEDFFKSQRQSGTQGNLNTNIVSDVLCMLPPLPEQQKIAAILTSVDEVIEKTQAQIDKLKDLKTAMMQELLTKGIGHVEFKDSPVGRIPVGWEVEHIGDLAEQVKPGPFGSSLTKAMYVEHGYKVYGQEQIIAGDLNVGHYYVDKEKYDSLGVFKIQAGEILISLVGTFGKVVVVPEQFEKGIINPRLLKLRFNQNSISPDFIAYQLRSDFVLSQLNQLQQGGTMGVLSATTIKPVKLIIPPLNVQLKISAMISSIDKNLQSKNIKLDSTKSIKKALMQDLLTGKVRVKVS